MDVIALAQHGIPCAVATSGTAITPDHLEQLVRLVPQVLFLLMASPKAAWRALENALPLMDGQTEFLSCFCPKVRTPIPCWLKVAAMDLTNSWPMPSH